MLTVGLLGLVCLVLQAPLMPAKALLIAPSPIPDRVANASTIVLGKVTAIEDKPVKASPSPGAAEVEYQIAVIQIDEALLGAKGLTHLRVGFLPPAAGRPGGPIRRYPSVQLTKDQEVCLFLQPHASGSFLVAPMYFDLIDKKNPNFDKEVAQIRHCLKLLADPKASLQARNPKDRLTTASMLLARYRTVKGQPKQEPIDAGESKLILKAIAEADWNARPTTPGEATPQTLFYRLGLTPQDGWTPPKNAKELPDAMKKWLTDNADSYRITRFVPETAEK
jgi:hypothetical protein